MKTAIIFASTHGTTEKLSQLLSEQLTGEVQLVNLKKKTKVILDEFDAIIIGGSIHAGGMQQKVKQFIEKNKEVLLAKKIGLFLCCMFDGEQAQKQFETAYPKELRCASISNGLFGGEFIFKKMNFVEKLIVKKVSGVTSDVSKIDIKAIEKFASDFNHSNRWSS
ncbi:MAG: flavodoxin [Firmicutes bacterium]|nr:flavodoxin [Bacillota bacterium]